MEKSQRGGNTVDYDIIFIGYLGAVVANLLRKSETTIKGLLIARPCEIKEPSLLPNHDPIIHIQNIDSREYDVESSDIYRLIPEENIVAMENKKVYHYRHLVYSASAEEWADYTMIENLKQALKTNFSFVYSNIMKWTFEREIAQSKFGKFLKQNPGRRRRASASLRKNSRKMMNSSLPFSKNDPADQFDNFFLLPTETSVNIVFYVPKPPHRGCTPSHISDDNFNILYKLDEFTKNLDKMKKSSDKSCLGKLFDQIGSAKTSGNKKKTPQEEQQEMFDINCEILCVLILEGEYLFPQNKQIDKSAQEELISRGVNIMKNQKISKIDYLRRVVYVESSISNSSEEIQENIFSALSPKPKNKKNQLLVPYDYFYTILKQKTPALLTASNIDPYSNCPYTLTNSQFKNITIFGADLFPTINSFSAINYQALIISRNLSSSCSHLHRKKLEYNGLSEFPFWVDSKKFIRFRHKYSTNVEADFAIMLNMGQQLRKNSNFSKIANNGFNLKNLMFQNKDKEVPLPGNTQPTEQAQPPHILNIRNTSASNFVSTANGRKSTGKKQQKEEEKRQEYQIESCCGGWAASLKRSLFASAQVSLYYNLKSYGLPYYFFVPELSHECQFSRKMYIQ